MFSMDLIDSCVIRQFQVSTLEMACEKRWTAVTKKVSPNDNYDSEACFDVTISFVDIAQPRVFRLRD